MLVLGDLLSETDEHFTVTLRGTSNATLADATATGTIRDDDDRATPGNTFRDCAVCPQMVTVPAAGAGLLRGHARRHLQRPRGARRLLGQRAGTAALGLPRLVRPDPPQPPQRLPRRPQRAVDRCQPL